MVLPAAGISRKQTARVCFYFLARPGACSGSCVAASSPLLAREAQLCVGFSALRQMRLRFFCDCVIIDPVLVCVCLPVGQCPWREAGPPLPTALVCRLPRGRRNTECRPWSGSGLHSCFKPSRGFCVGVRHPGRGRGKPSLLSPARCPPLPFQHVVPDSRRFHGLSPQCYFWGPVASVTGFRRFSDGCSS